MHSWKLLTYLLDMSPPRWSIPHSTVNLRPLAPTYVVPSEAGQAMLDGEAVALVEETELAGELEVLLVETDAVELDVPVLEVAVDETVDETLSSKSLAPQIEGLFAAVPRIFFR
jgi:hypothetical protein